MSSHRLSIYLVLCITLLATVPASAEYFITDLVDAARRGDYHAVHRLIAEAPEKVDDTDASGYTALHWAGIGGDWRSFAELVAAGAPINAVGGDGGTPLHWACHHDRPEMVQLLLEAGADIGVQNRWGRTPLHVTARRGCGRVAELLLEAGADPNVVTREGWSPLHVAYRAGHPELVDLLLAHGAEAELADSEGLRPADSTFTRPTAITVNLDTLDDFVGIYDLGGGFPAKVWLENGGLRFREFAPDHLMPIGDDEFFCRQEPWKLRFLRDATGRVESVHMHFLRRTVVGVKTPSPRYVGSKACVACHSGTEHGSQDIAWMRSRHGHAYWRLGTDWALYLALLRPNYQDMTDPITDDRCLLCHTVGRQEPNSLYAASYRQQEGVGCEACHGPGSNYIDPEIMADRKAFLAAGGRIPDQSTCRSCHRNSERFDWAELWPKIEHGRPDSKNPGSGGS